jgi:hypothetical protein
MGGDLTTLGFRIRDPKNPRNGARDRDDSLIMKSENGREVIPSQQEKMYRKKRACLPP